VRRKSRKLFAVQIVEYRDSNVPLERLTDRDHWMREFRVRECAKILDDKFELDHCDKQRNVTGTRTRTRDDRPIISSLFHLHVMAIRLVIRASFAEIIT